MPEPFKPQSPPDPPSSPKERMRVLVAEDRRSVTIEFLPESGAAGALDLTSDQLTKLIGGLGAARQKMLENASLPRLEGQKIDAVFNTRWYIQPEPLSEGSLLCFYHPAFGPVGFVVPPDQVSEIVRLLTAHLGISRSTGGKLN